MKTLGILGGMGPLGTIKLFEMLVEMTDASNDQEHLHIIIDNNTKIPDRSAFILDDNKENPLGKLKESVMRLESAGVDLIVMPCNTAHYYYDEIIKSIDIPFLNMIEETAIWIKGHRPNLKKIGLLATDGTIKSRIYDKIFLDYGIEIVVPSDERQRHVYDFIYNIKENREQDNLNGFYKAMEDIEEEGVEIFIAGCTEISVALDKYKIKGDFIDPMEIVARKSINLLGGKVKKSKNIK